MTARFLPCGLAVLLLSMLFLTACGAARPPLPDRGDKNRGDENVGGETARLASGRVIAEDGYALPLHRWSARQESGQPAAIVLGVHGFNDHGGSFERLANRLTPQGITLYAHDQRGFGNTASRGRWPGHERLVKDVRLMVRLLRERHPDTPLYLAGHSMGGAVVLLAMEDGPLDVAGSVLISPAVWGLADMPWYRRFALWLGVRLFPGLSFSGDIVETLGIRATDDPEIRRQLAKDPRVLHHARVDALHGVSVAMERALEAAPALQGPALLLYGEKDDLIPPEAICHLLEKLPPADEGRWRMALYPEGYHMLTRYTRREQTAADIGAWLFDPAATLPSGHALDKKAAQRRLCR